MGIGQPEQNVPGRGRPGINVRIPQQWRRAYQSDTHSQVSRSCTECEHWAIKVLIVAITALPLSCRRSLASIGVHWQKSCGIACIAPTAETLCGSSFNVKRSPMTLNSWLVHSEWHNRLHNAFELTTAFRPYERDKTTDRRAERNA